MEHHRRHVINKALGNIFNSTSLFSCFEMGNQKVLWIRNAMKWFCFFRQTQDHPHVYLMCHNFVLDHWQPASNGKPPTIQVPYARVNHGSIWQPKRYSEVSGFLLQSTCISGDFPETVRWNLKKGIQICVSVCSKLQIGKTFQFLGQLLVYFSLWL